MGGRGVGMKVGCGFVRKTIHGGRYLYVWTFEARGSGYRRVERYIGPADSPQARAKTLATLDGYAQRAAAQIDRRRARWRRQLASP